MLTCEEIAARARAISTAITRDNCEAIAAQILPFVVQQQPPRRLTTGERAAVERLPEVVEEHRATARMTQDDDDWADMVAVWVTTAQANAARNAFYASLVASQA